MCPGPFTGGGAGGAAGGTVGSAIGGPIGGAIGSKVGSWIGKQLGGLLGGHPTPIDRRIQDRFRDHPKADWDSDYLAPKLRALREYGLGDGDDNNLDRWFMDNIVGHYNDVVIMRANDLGTVAAFEAAIPDLDAGIAHHGPGHEQRSNPKKILLLDTIVAYLSHLKEQCYNAIDFINSGGSTAGGGSATGGAPVGPPGVPVMPPGATPSTPGFAGLSKTAIIVAVGAAVGLLALRKGG